MSLIIWRNGAQSISIERRDEGADAGALADSDAQMQHVKSANTKFNISQLTIFENFACGN